MDAFYNSNDILNKSRKERNKEEFKNKKREKKLLKKKTKRTNDKESIDKKIINEIKSTMDILKNENYEIEYIEDNSIGNELKNNLKQVLDYFQIPKKEDKENTKQDNYEEDEYNDSNQIKEADEKNKYDKLTKEQRLSKKKLKQMKRIKLVDLKQLTKYPEVVESWDVTAQDPKLLIYFKSLKNTVPVPKHWAQKRKYLQNKRGVLRPPFLLPDFIEATGISKIRNTELNEKRGLKQKMRDRMQPKLGKMDIDYQVLHDAFFKYQTKPQLSIIGDVYYENKEFESKMKVFQPGRISEKLRMAMGIAENTPPPFVVNMQRYGPPPSYPNLKIPGVNAPICDPTAEITPNLWTPPEENNKKELVWDFKDTKDHWGIIREIDEDEEMDDIEENNDDLSLSDNERAEVTDLFKNNMSNDNEANYSINQFKALNSIPNPNANVIFGNKHFQNEEGKFYSVIQEKEGKVNEGEIYPSNYSYVIPKIVDKSNKEKESPKNKDQSNSYNSKLFS